ncbi:MAG: Ppx/GppA phosphatase family protein [Bacteroidota bacterium]
MRIAAIDIGTNTVLLLVAEVDQHGKIDTLAYEQRLPRLGRGVAEHHNVTREAMEAVARVLMEFRVIYTSLNVEKVIACGTSAVRAARNRNQFLAHIKAVTGLDVSVLSGDEEALWTYRGALSGIREVGSLATVIDIGGGSTEVIVGDRKTVHQRLSLDIGSVHLTERYLKRSPPDTEEVEHALRVVQMEFERLSGFHFSGTVLVGVAGTVTTVAALAQGLPTFDLSKIAGYRLSKNSVDRAYRMLRMKTADQIRKLSDVTEGRADILFAGVLILREFMERFKFGTIITSERGVRYGLVMQAWERKFTGNERRFTGNDGNFGNW